MQIRARLASFSLFASLAVLAGCGDDIPREDGGSGGSTGGSIAGAGGGGSGGTGGSIGGSGGGGTGGGGTGGSIGGSGGRGGTGGGGTGGGGTGGGGTGGSIGGTGGRGGTGGGGTGGGGTGGGGTGGGGTGGGGTGGGGTGGGGTGGGGTGGGGTGGTGGTPCYTVAFVAPTNGSTLTVADDTGATCADGFQYIVRITTNAPDGTTVLLFNTGNVLLGNTTVASGAASFNVQLPQGASALSIQFPSTVTCTQSAVTVTCPPTPPTCTISAPTITTAHPMLNGVLFPAGDRATQSGSTYQVTFTVTTNAEDGQPVSLSYNDAASPGSVQTLPTVNASGGSATFGVPLAPDATYQVVATCRNANGVSASSPLGTFPVDTTAPNLTVSSPPASHFFGPSMLDSLGRFNVCARTTSADAAGLPSSLGAAASNLCVALGGSATCAGTAPVTAINTDTCVPIVCPGGAPFDITVTLKDTAGNPTSTIVQAVSCASSLPSVQVITPVSDAPAFNDPSRHILNANAPVGVRDLDANVAGAQVNVVACTDRNGTATLEAGLSGALATLGSVATVAAVAGDNCPSGLGFVARFSGVTLVESVENADGTIMTSTDLSVSVADALNPSSVGISVPVRLWVDTIPPVLSLLTPANLCGLFIQSAITITQAVSFTAENDSVVVQVTNGSVTDTYPPPPVVFSGGVATFPAIEFDPGQNNLTATETDPAGNLTTLAPAPCSVIIGSAPVVTFNTPTAGQILCPVGSTVPGCILDTDDTTPGWQGSVAVHVTGDGQPITSGNVTFSIGGTTIGGGPAPLDSNGNATLTAVTLPEGSITIVATTDNIPNRGVGTGSVTVTVDLGQPAAPTALTATVSNRRRTSVQLNWTAPGDNGVAVSGYDIRYARTQITDDTSFNAATAVTYTGQPPAPGSADGILVDNLYIENDYFFAVKARDAAGNLSPMIATTSAVAAHFNTAVIASPSGTDQLFGALIDGSFDVNGDGFSDLLVSTVNDGRAYLFLGASTFAPSAPSVTFSSLSSTFGLSARMIGDIDADGLQDLAISDQNSQIVRIYKGRAIWPATLMDTQSDYVISTDATWALSGFGAAMAPLGDFDGDGVEDFAIGAAGFNGLRGRVAVIYGRAGFTSFGLPDTTRSLEIGADPALNRSELGLAVVGIGHFYSVTSGTTLVVSAPGLGGAASTSSNEGRIYAFHGRGPGAAIDATAADHVMVGPGKPAKIGQTLANLGPVVNGLASVGVGNSADALSVPGSNGSAFVLSGATATGPLASSLVLYQQGGNAVGQVIFGGGFSGRDASVSIIGDSRADVAMTSLQNGNTIDIIDGSKVAGLSSPANTRLVADVHVPLPAGWTATALGLGDLIRDINGDGFADFALGDQFGVVPGRVVVFW